LSRLPNQPPTSARETLGMLCPHGFASEQGHMNVLLEQNHRNRIALPA